MRILTFSTLFPNREHPNSAIFVRHRMAAVQKYCDAEVRVVAPIPWYPNLPIGSERYRSLARVPHNEVIAGLPVAHPRYPVTPKVGMSLYGLFMFLGTLSTLRRIYREWPFDLIDAHYVYPDGFAAILLGKIFKCPVVVSARGTDINLYPQFKMIRPLIRQVLTRSAGIISVCQSLADIMVEMGADSKKVRVIPNGIDPNSFHPVHRDIARKHLGINTEGKTLLTVGALIKRKGIHLLIDALNILNQRHALDWTTYIIGKGEEQHHLKEQILDARLQDKVYLAGEVPNTELVNWYNSADLFFLGSSREGWPNVVSESLACGTPVVATDVNGIPDILTSPELGIVVERKVSAFVKAIQEGFARQWDRSAIAAKGQQRTWEQVAEEVFSFLSQVHRKRQ